MKNPINYLDLFSGCGGFRLGLEQAGFKFAWEGHSEINKTANTVYVKHFPKSEVLGDVQTVDVNKLPKPDLITFGFPCQDLSVAGKRSGLRGKRSGLFFEAMRIIKDALPEVFIFENVKGLLSSNGGRDFTTILREIADIGLYDCEWQLLNSQWFLPQYRERIYFVGHLRGKSKPRVFPYFETGEVTTGNKIPFRSRTGIEPVFNRAMSSGARRTALLGRRLRYFTETEYARLQGFPDDWFNGLTLNQTRKLVGNSVTIPIIEMIGKKLL